MVASPVLPAPVLPPSTLQWLALTLTEGLGADSVEAVGGAFWRCGGNLSRVTDGTRSRRVACGVGAGDFYRQGAGSGTAGDGETC